MQYTHTYIQFTYKFILSAQLYIRYVKHISFRNQDLKNEIQQNWTHCHTLFWIRICEKKKFHRPYIFLTDLYIQTIYNNKASIWRKNHAFSSQNSVYFVDSPFWSLLHYYYTPICINTKFSVVVVENKADVLTQSH